ncbi:MAG: tetratricopeptide repeat protein [Actinomycetota bacterium]
MDNHADSATLMAQALYDPVPALAEAESWVASDAPVARIIGLRARGLARRQLGEFEESAEDLTVALAMAERGDPDLWAAVGITLAGTWVHQGNVVAAKELLGRCIDRAEGRTEAEARYQLGITHAQVGELDEALDQFEIALPLIRGVSERGWEADLMGARGTTKIYRGDYDGAIEDLEAALNLARETSKGPSQLALYMNNTAYALHLRGDITESIDRYAEAEAYQEAHGLPTTMFAHRANAYLAAGMYEETVSLAVDAYSFHRQGKAAVGAIEALLAGADAALALGAPERAEQLAGQALALDDETSFPVWAARAETVLLEVARARGEAPPDWAERSRRANLDAQGGDSAVAARSLLVGTAVAIEVGALDVAAQLLAEADPAVSNAPQHLAIERWRLRALLAKGAGESPAVVEAVKAGLDEYRTLVASSPSFDMSHKAARHAEGLAELAAPELLAGGAVEQAVTLIESARVSAICEVDPAASRMEPSQRLRAVTFVESEDELLAIETGSGSIGWLGCGGIEQIRELVDRHAFLHRQVARSARLSDGSGERLRNEVARLDQELSDRLFPGGAEGPIAINPSMSLASVVWGALPALRSPAFTVVPARALATGRDRPPESVLVLGSSELDHVRAEVDRVAAIWGAAAELDPSRAVLNRLNGVGLVHVGGHFVNDHENPLLSSLPLGDVALRGHDYARLDRPPRMLVLSACASGTTVQIGSAPVGFVTAALAAGTETVIATTSLIEDGPAVLSVMGDLHERLSGGHDPAEAVARIRTDATGREVAIAGSLCVFGAGWRT